MDDSHNGQHQVHLTLQRPGLPEILFRVFFSGRMVSTEVVRACENQVRMTFIRKQVLKQLRRIECKSYECPKMLPRFGWILKKTKVKEVLENDGKIVSSTNPK